MSGLFCSGSYKINKTSKRILWEPFAIHMLFQGVEFLTVKPATSPHHPHTNITTHTPSPIFPPSLCLTYTQIHIHCFTVSALPLHSTVQTSYTSVLQADVQAVIFNCSVGRKNRCTQLSAGLFQSFSCSLRLVLAASLHLCCHCRNCTFDSSFFVP